MDFADHQDRVVGTGLAPDVGQAGAVGVVGARAVPVAIGDAAGHVEGVLAAVAPATGEGRGLRGRAAAAPQREFGPAVTAVVHHDRGLSGHGLQPLAVGLIVQAQPDVDFRHVHARQGVVRVKLQGFPQRRPGAVHAVLLEIHARQGRVHAGGAGAELDRQFALLDRLGILVHLQVRQRPVAMHQRPVGLQLEGLVVFGEGLAELARLHVDRAEVVVRPGGGGIE